MPTCARAIADQIRHSVTAGWSAPACASAYGVDVDAVRAILRGHRRLVLTDRCVRWIRWLRSQGIPMLHIAQVMGRPPTDVEMVTRSSGIVPDGPPYRRRASLDRPVTGWQTKCRELVALGYPHPRIATLLAVDLAHVTDYLKRIEPKRGRALVKPRTRQQQAQTRRNERKRKRREKRKERQTWARREWQRCPPRGPHPDAWRWRDDVGPDGCALTPAAPPPEEPEYKVLDWIGADPPPPPADWTPPAWPKRKRGRAKLSPDEAAEIRRRRAAGESIHSLSRAFRVARQTIYALLKGITWREAPPAPPSGDVPLLLEIP